MQIHQINCQYLPIEDRLLLRINTTEHFEHQFLVTRRYLKLILKAMTEHFKACEQTTHPVATPEAQKALGQFEHQEAIQKTDMQQAYEPASSKAPSQSQLQLLHTLKVKSDQKNQIVLGLLTKDNKGVELALPKEMAHSFFHLLEKTIIMAEWDLDLYFISNALPENQKIQ